jgi:hypothetical protein
MQVHLLKSMQNKSEHAGHTSPISKRAFIQQINSHKHGTLLYCYMCL